MPEAKNGPVYHLTLRALADPEHWPAPPARRLARLLKALRRAYGFVVEDYQEVKEKEERA